MALWTTASIVAFARRGRQRMAPSADAGGTIYRTQCGGAWYVRRRLRGFCGHLHGGLGRVARRKPWTPPSGVWRQCVGGWRRCRASSRVNSRGAGPEQCRVPLARTAVGARRTGGAWTRGRSTWTAIRVRGPLDCGGGMAAIGSCSDAWLTAAAAQWAAGPSPAWPPEGSPRGGTMVRTTSPTACVPGHRRTAAMRVRALTGFFWGGRTSAWFRR